jgi:uroporphyrinogen decarboxylase
MFAKFIKPYFKERISYTRKYTDAYFLHHSCGNVFKLIPDLIEAGVDILNPIQPVTDSMSPESLKKNFGDNLCFHGGIDTQAILPFGSREQIETEVKDVIDVMSEGGGYIFAAAHNIQEDVPPENLIIMFQAARRLYK